MKVFVIDDDKDSGEAVAGFVRDILNHKVVLFQEPNKALAQIDDSVKLVITDLKMPEISGLEVLKKIKAFSENIEVVIMTGFSDVNSAVNALRFGAIDYLLKPLNIEQLADIIETVEDAVKSTNKNNLDREPKCISYRIEGIGEVSFYSQKMKNIIHLIHKLKEDRSIAVMIEGETGTGKEIIARLLHHENKNPFISVNCAAISQNLFESELFGYEAGAFTGGAKEGAKGKFEAAEGGTIFLDELGDLPIELQPKLLRAIQQREFFRIGATEPTKMNVRIVVATNKGLRKMVENGDFRKDLYYRLSVMPLELPPLRERKEDIIHLAKLFMAKMSKQRQKSFEFIPQETKDILLNYNWPGNIRELENAIERIILLYDNVNLKPEYFSFLAMDSLSPKLLKSFEISLGNLVLPEEKLSIQALENEIVAKAMLKFKNNKTKVADYLGLTRSALRSRLSKL